MGGPHKVAAAAPTVLNGIRVQSSVAGRAIPMGWGTHRVSANLIWYDAFEAIAHNQSTAGGKGGGAKNTSTTYTYTASIVLGVEKGPVSGIRTVYVDQSVFVDGAGGQTALQQAGLSLATGAIGQAPWGYLTTNFPDQALGYSGVAYAYAAGYSLLSSASLPNHSFEVVTPVRNAGQDDANAADVIPDFLSHVPFWPAGLIGDLSDYRLYTDSVGLVVSPVIDTQRQASDFVTELLRATNSDAYFSEGVLKIRPYGDTAVGAWVPDLTPVIDLTDDHFIPRGKGEDPVLVDRTRGADAWNYVQVEFLDRTNHYNSNIAVGFDQANADQYGRLSNTSPFSIHSICLPSAAQACAQLLVQRSANVRAKFSFDLPEGFNDLLEPMDLVTITTGDLDRVLVRITRFTEQTAAPGDGGLTIISVEAEEMLVGTAHAAAFASITGGGYKPDYDIAPGGVADVALVNPNRALTNGDYELWLLATGASAAWGGAQVWTSTDGVSYGYTGVDIIAPGRLGRTVNELPVHADPDSDDFLDVDLTASAGVLLSGSKADADNAVTLCLVGDELVSYETATLTGSFQYALSYLRRGLYGSAIADHPAGASFLRLDSAVARAPYLSQQVGTVMHVKLLSFNVYGRAIQQLSDVTDYQVVLDPGAPPVIDIIANDTKNVGGVPATQVLNDLATALTNIEGLVTQAAQLQADVDTNALSLLAQVVNHTALKAYFDNLVWVGQTPAKTAILNETSARQQGDTAIVTIISLIGAESTDGTAFVLNAGTVKVSPTQTLADYVTQVTANLGGNAAAISNEAIARSTADTATAQLISLIGAQTIDGAAFVLNQSTAFISPTQSLASYVSGVATSLGSNSSAISSESITRANADSALSSSLFSLSSTVGSHTSQISSLFTSVNGLSSQWVLSLDSNGHIAGLQLANSSTHSSFVIVADELIFSDSAGSLQSPFYISGGQVFADNLVVQKLRAGIIVTDHIQNGQVTQLSSAIWSLGSGPGVSTLTLVASAGITLTDTANSAVHASWAQGQDGTHLHWGFSLYLDGVAVGIPLAFNLAQGLCSFDYAFDGLSPGFHQVDLYISGDTQTSFGLGCLTFGGSMR